MALSQPVIAHIQTELASCQHGERGDIVNKLANTYGVSTATIYRNAKVNGTKRRRERQKPQYEQWVQIAVLISQQSVKGKPIPFDLAIEIGIQNGQLPPEAEDMPLGTANRIRREMNLVEKPKRTHRLSADYPMQAVQIDGSTSEHLIVEKVLDNGDHLLKLHRKPFSASGYKNKPLGPDRLRLQIYSAWDMCTGYRIARYAAAKGENALDAMEFLCWALAEKDDARIPFHGVPDDLWSDQGALFKSGPARDLLDRLDINVEAGEAYAKERQGGVENTHRTRWSRFERVIFAMGVDTITLSELNQRLMEYYVRENRRNARCQVAGKTVSRHDAWVALTNGRSADNPLRKLPDNPIETMAQEVRRHVDQNGILSWDNVEYEFERIHCQWVIARRPMDGTNAIIAEVESTGERHIATPYQPRPYGKIVGNPKTELDTLNDSSLGKSDLIPCDLYAPSSAADKPGNLFTIKAQSSDAASLENPLDAAHYADLTQAMIAFTAIYHQPLSPDNRAKIKQHLADNHFDKDVVRDLAMQLAGLKEASQ